MNGPHRTEEASHPTAVTGGADSAAPPHGTSDAEVRARASQLNGVAAAGIDVTRVHEETRGDPRLVDLVIAAIRDEGWDLDPDGPVPDVVLSHVAGECDALGPAVREFLLAHAVGFAATPSAFATAPRFSNADTRSLRASARARGLVAPDGTLAPLVRRALLGIALPDETWSLRRELVDTTEAAGLPLGDIAEMLARDGFRDPRLATALEVRGDAVLTTDPRNALALYALAIDAGADAAAVEARRATAAWAAGDIRGAERLVDRMLGRGGGTDLCRAIPVAAAAWSRQGMLGRSADAYARLTGDHCELGPLAAICLAAVGEIDRARSIRAEIDEVAYPTSSHVALELTADGLLEAIDGDVADRALATLLRASNVMSESTEVIPLPEAPAVLAAAVAMNAGELAIADDVLNAAISAEQGGPAFRARLLLMQSLVSLRADRPVRARELLQAGEADAASHPRGLRDEVLAVAVRVGLARHQGEISLLVRAWAAARPAIAAMQVDVTTLPVLSELTVAAARLGEASLMRSHLAAAWDLLDRIGRPPSWSTALRWTEIEAALLRNEPAAVERHAAVLDSITGHRIAAGLARAGRTWAAALGGDVDVEAVEVAVRDLTAAGYRWDAGRLAGHAAGRAAEHRDTLHLLALARSLHPDEPGSPIEGASGPTVPPPASGASDAPNGDGARLSAREREVARLVLEGKTYAEIGDAIFISPRTAEHHIARIRRRLGASGRSDLMARLRIALEDDSAG
jgi:DNA-binding CsgD family transcriptional regulator